MRRLPSTGLGLVACVLLCSSSALAVPGPDSVVVVANASIPESVALAERYAATRRVPTRQVCALDLPATDDIPLDVFRASLVEPLRACLGETLSRIEAVLLVRGVPLRVDIGATDGCGRASLAAALGLWDSTSSDGTPLVEHAPGREVMCAGGAACCAARWANPFRTGVFEPGWSRDSTEAAWRPLLVTMLNGRSFEDAGRLLDSALAAERPGATRGQLLFMDGADPARGSLDATYDSVIAGLADRGVADVDRVPFNPDLTGRTLGAFFVGTASIGTTIEGNAFSPGAIVDNLTSFGAVPQNFAPTGESQVSIARWVARGVAGVHGTTDEPLANSFPARRLLLDYVDGATLAEAYLRNMPFVHWQNLVLGDPMAAPYAVRPVVRIEGVAEAERIAGSRAIRVSAEDPAGRGPVALSLLVDGVLVASSDGEPISHCLAAGAPGPVSVLAVAQAADDGTDRGLHRPKGWTAIDVEIAAGDTTCAEPDSGLPAAVDSGLPIGDASAPAPDSGAFDGGNPADAGNPTDAAATDMAIAHDDGGTAPRDHDGCGCRVLGATSPSRGPSIAVLLAAVTPSIAIRARRRRATASAPRRPPARR